MANQTTQYWIDVHDKMAEITATCADGEHSHQQPPDHVFITSLKNAKHRTTGGRVCGAPLKLAAMRCVDGTHRVGTDAEVKTHMEEQARKKVEMESAAAAAKGQITFTAPPPVPSVAR